MRAFSSCRALMFLAMLFVVPGCTLFTIEVCCEDACCGRDCPEDDDGVADDGELDSTTLNWEPKGTANWYPSITVTVNRLRPGSSTPDATLEHSWFAYGSIGDDSGVCDFEMYPDEDYLIDADTELGSPKTKWVMELKLADMVVPPGKWVSLEVVVKPNRGAGSTHETRILHMCGQAPSGPPTAE